MVRRTPSLVAIVAERMLHCKATQVEMVSDSVGDEGKVNSRAAKADCPKRIHTGVIAFRNDAMRALEPARDTAAKPQARTYASQSRINASAAGAACTYRIRRLTVAAP